MSGSGYEAISIILGGYGHAASAGITFAVVYLGKNETFAV